MVALERAAHLIDSVNDWVGRTFAWVALGMVLVQFLIVVMRYVFSIGSIMMQESVVYMHAVLFLLGAGYTLLHEGHVRVDVFYRVARRERRALVDLAGVVLFLLPVCALIFVESLPYVENSWAVSEGSKETSGIQYVYLLKTTILGFSVLVALQGISLALHALLTLAGRPSGIYRDDADAA